LTQAELNEINRKRRERKLPPLNSAQANQATESYRQSGNDCDLATFLIAYAILSSGDGGSAIATPEPTPSYDYQTPSYDSGGSGSYDSGSSGGGSVD
jgi:hypothetical protein